MHRCNLSTTDSAETGRFQKLSIQQDQLTVNSNIGEKSYLKMKIKVEAWKIDSVNKARLITKCQKKMK